MLYVQPEQTLIVDDSYLATCLIMKLLNSDFRCSGVVIDVQVSVSFERVLDRVINRHIDMNRHQLDEVST